MFGDGTISNTQNPAHIYTYSDTFNVSLTVVDVNGCQNFHQLSNAVVGLEMPHAAFTSPMHAACNAPLNVQFYDASQSPTSTISSWSWSFGDGGTSTVPSPTRYAPHLGSYNVSLTVMNGLGCTNTITDTNFVWLGTITAGFFGDTLACTGQEVFSLTVQWVV